MGAVAVLHRQDCHRLHRDNLISPPMKSRRSPKSNPKTNPHPNPNFTRSGESPNSNPISNPNSTRSDRRKRSPTGLHRNNNNNNDSAMVANRPAKDLVMGQVKILRRGEALENTAVLKDRVFDQKNAKKCSKLGDLDDFVLSSTDRLGPEPEMVPKQIKLADLYAGYAFVDSPPPSSLPVPAFFTKRLASAAVKDDPTMYLRRILGLNLP